MTCDMSNGGLVKGEAHVCFRWIEIRKHEAYSDQQNCPDVWYLSMVLKITYELPQMETNYECMKVIH